MIIATILRLQQSISNLQLATSNMPRLGGVSVLLFIITFNPIFAQKTKKPKKLINTTVGFQYCPIIPNKFIGPVQFNISQNNIDFIIKEKPSYFGGMEIRFDFTNFFAVQTGINYAKRNFEISVQDAPSGITDRTKCKFIGYEIPALGLIYIRLSEYIYMNNSFGMCIDFFPTDIKSETKYLRHYSRRNSWVKMGLLANVGWEWRTNKSGYFYLGASYQRLFTYLLLTQIQYKNNNTNNIALLRFPGHYFAINIKYFFPKQQETEQ